MGSRGGSTRCSEVVALPGGAAGGIDPDLALADEADELHHLGELAKILDDPVDRVVLGPALLVEDPEGLPQGIDGVLREPRASEADDVEAADAVVSLLQDERRDILGGRGQAAEHGESADPHPLLHGRVAREDAAVEQHAVAADEGPIHQRAVVAQDDVVAEMRTDHHQVAIADPGLPDALGRPAMHRDVLAEAVAVADDHAGLLAAIPAVLRGLAQHGTVADVVVPAHLERAGEAGVAINDGPGADLDGPFDDGIGADLDVRGEFDLGADHGGRVDQIRHGQRHHPLLLERRISADILSPLDRYRFNRPQT